MGSCIIQPRRSSLSTIVVMGRKHDNSWRMCLVYRDLRKITIKDKFPILDIHDLLYELHGAAYFTKLDIKSRYHKIILRKQDFPKTTFRTHHGHYDLLVMPFGMTSSPTFEVLMKKKTDPNLESLCWFFLMI
jgi:hypothetical protein